jgi:uncharacterized protein YgfB (UPF0149 family)
VRQVVEYQWVEDAFRRAGVLGEPAEVHGSLCAVLCILGGGGTEVWRADSLQNVDEDNAQLAAGRSAMEQLELTTWAALNGSGMDFAPLLPADSSGLAVRVEALAHWCQGFLYGVSLCGVIDPSQTSSIGAEHLDELVKDLAEISRAGLSADDDETDADFAYAELVEFLRAGVQLVFEELEGFRAGSGDAARALH